VLRPASTADLAHLVTAASSSDRELDRALGDVGILPPADLTDIRNVLGHDGTQVAMSRNADGHAILQVTWDGDLGALIHHDGRVHVLRGVAA
jgi:hypothetical protein